MIRLNNKDFTEEQLEKLLELCQTAIGCGEMSDACADEMKIEHDTKPMPIEWGFKLNILFVPKRVEDTKTIKEAMRSPFVNEVIRQRFEQIVRFEINSYVLGLQTHCTTDEYRD